MMTNNELTITDAELYEMVYRLQDTLGDYGDAKPVTAPFERTIGLLMMVVALRALGPGSLAGNVLSMHGGRA